MRVTVLERLELVDDGDRWVEPGEIIDYPDGEKLAILLRIKAVAPVEVAPPVTPPAKPAKE